MILNMSLMMMLVMSTRMVNMIMMIMMTSLKHDDYDGTLSQIIHEYIDFCKNLKLFRLQVLTSGSILQTKEQKNC